MQIHRLSTHHHTADPDDAASSLIKIFIYLAALIHFAILVFYVAGQLEIKPTVLIIKNEGCRYLQQVGLNAQVQKSSNSCRIQVPYRSHLFVSGGTIYLEDKHISLSENQIVAVAPLEDQPYSTAQIHLLYWLGAAFVVLMLIRKWALSK